MLKASLRIAITAFAATAVACATSACSSSSSGSGGDSGDNGGGLPAFNSIDTTVSCPAGQIGWNYTTGGGSLDTSVGTALSGVQILTSSYGANCNANLANDEVPTAVTQCNGQTECDFHIGLTYDPAYGCAKNFATTWACGADSTVYSGSVGGEAGGQIFKYDCGQKINVHSAQTQVTCLGQAEAPINAGSPVSQTCNNLTQCTYNQPDYQGTGLCSETLNATWSCGSNPKIYSQTVTINGYGAYNQYTTPFSIVCSGTPAINVQQATWGGNCSGVPAGNLTTQVTSACGGNTTGTCPFTVGGIGDPHYGCAKNFEVKYTCGTDPYVYDSVYPAEAGGKTYSLSCSGATPFTSGNTQVSTGQKACIATSCPYNQPRNPSTEQCGPVDNTRAQLSSISLRSYDFHDNVTSKSLNPSVFNAGPTTISSNSPATLTTELNVYGPAADFNIEPWMTYLFFSKTGQSAEGFLCALTPMDVNTAGTLGYVVANSGNKVLPASCFDARSNPYADAAARMGMTEAQFRNQYTYSTALLHFSWDVEGKYGLQGQSLPNPPGFFYKAASNYTDFISFYQQRELTSIQYGPGDTPWPSLKWNPNPPTEYSQAYNLQTSTAIEVNLDGVDTRKGSVLDINYFAPVGPSISEDVHWSLVGDAPVNPLSPTTTNPQSSVRNLAQANMRATVELYPAGQSPNSTVVLGTIPLAGGAPTGTTTNGTLTFPQAALTQIFGAWKNYNTFSLKTCIDLDGVNTRSGATIPIPDTSIYSGKINGECNLQTNVILVNRTYIKYAIATQETANAVSNGDSTSKGDGANSSTDGTSSETACTNNGTSIVCTATQQSGANGGGNLAQSFYSSTAVADTVHNIASNSDSAGNTLNAEALGFQIVNVHLIGNGFPAGAGSTPNPLQDISIAPNWQTTAASVGALNVGVVNMYDPGGITQAAQTGIYGGHEGVGIGTGIKQGFGGFGAINVNFAVGVSMDSSFQWSNRQPTAFTCNGAKGGKCFRRTANVMTQPDAAKECEVEGGQLANLVTSSDVANALASVSSFPSQYNFWTGGQENYELPNAACAGQATPTSACTASGKTHFDWSDPVITEFGIATGTSNSVAITAANVGTQNLQLTNFAPTPAGVSLNQTGFLRNQVQSQLNYGICQFDAASSTSYTEFHLDAPIGAGAGVSLQACWPSSDVGVCLQGTLNYIGIAFEPQINLYSTTLYDPSRRAFGFRGDTNVNSPWSVTLLSGEIDFIAQFLFWSTSYKLYQYPGYALAQGALASYDWPSQENF